MMKKYMLIAVLCVISLFWATVVWAQGGDSTDQSGSTDENALFGGENGENDSSKGDDLLETPQGTSTSNTATPVEKSLLVNNVVQIGGKYHFYATAAWSWINPDFNNFPDTLVSPDSDGFSTDLGATLYFDARPNENFRVFGKTDISYPFSQNEETGRSFDDIVHIRELFSDFNWKNILFFRGGKQVINWGVGYFFSPADIVNLTSINPEDPEAELEGPLALKINFPFGIHNAYLYFIDDNATRWYDVTLAPKFEFVIYDTEIGIGGVYRKDRSPEVMATVTTSVSDFNIFGESVLSYGSDNNFIEEVDKSLEYPMGLRVVKKDDQFFYSGTVGLMYNHNDEEGNFSYNFIFQYYYNGYGYDDQSIFKDEKREIGILIGNGELDASDIAMPGKHYTALSIGWNKLLNSDFNLSVFWMGNLSDGSGKVTPSISYNWTDEIRIDVSAPFTYGEEGYQFSKNGDTMELNLKFSFGSASF